MRDSTRLVVAIGFALACVSGAQADPFGTGANQFTIDFVTIPGNPGVACAFNTSGDPVETFTSGVGVGDYTDPGNDYRMGVFEITNDQWDKFKNNLGVPVTGHPSWAYDDEPDWGGASVPTDHVSWYEAAQFVNWLNTSTGHQPAYKFTGTQGQSDYELDTWSPAEADNGTNLYRHKDAFYYLPTEDEWVKAAYWDGAALQTYANASPDDLVDGRPHPYEWNYYPSGLDQPWNVGSGVEELNGTFDMMGNLWEWMENPYSDPAYGTSATRGIRGGAFDTLQGALASSMRPLTNAYYENQYFGFRVASDIPEPATLSLLAIGALVVARRRRATRT